MRRSREADRAAVAAALAAGVASRRQAAGLSLSRLAEGSGLSVGFLSQIESAQANPTLAAMAQLAAGLGTGLSELLAPSPRPPGGDRDLRARVRRPPVGPGAGTPGRVWELTAPGATLRACLVHATPGDHAEPTTHAGEELVVVLRGGYRLHLGERAEDLHPEDLAQYAATQPHALTPLREESRALIILARA